MEETNLIPNDEVIDEFNDPIEEVTKDASVDLLAELDTLRRRLEVAERTAREISAGWREFSELYPEADIASLPDSFNSAIERGIPPAAAYALELRRREVTKMRIDAANKRARELSAGKLEPTEDSLYSPDEVRAMSPSEVRKNIEKIRRSMKSWR